MFPQAHDTPPSRLERGISCAVPFNVTPELGCPVPLVAGGLAPVLGTYVPEAPIYKDRDLARSEDDVRTDPHAAGQVQPEVLSIPVASRVQCAAKRNLGLGVRTAVRLHVARASLARRPRIGSCSPGPLPSVLAAITGHSVAVTHSNHSAVRCMSEDTAYDLIPAEHTNTIRRPTWRILK